MKFVIVVALIAVLGALASAGLFVADRRSGQVYQFFNPGFGVSASPAIAGNTLYVLTNSAVFYALSLRDLAS